MFKNRFFLKKLLKYFYIFFFEYFFSIISIFGFFFVLNFSKLFLTSDLKS